MNLETALAAWKLLKVNSVSQTGISFNQSNDNIFQNNWKPFSVLKLNESFSVTWHFVQLPAP